MSTLFHNVIRGPLQVGTPIICYNFNMLRDFLLPQFLDLFKKGTQGIFNKK
jgi:hypothetical protein